MQANQKASFDNSFLIELRAMNRVFPVDEITNSFWSDTNDNINSGPMIQSESEWALMNFVEQHMKSEIPPPETPAAIAVDVVSPMESSSSKPDEFNELLHLLSNPFPMALLIPMSIAQFSKASSPSLALLWLKESLFLFIHAYICMID